MAIGFPATSADAEPFVAVVAVGDNASCLSCAVTEPVRMFEDDTVADWAERPQTSAMNGYADRCGSFRLVVDGGNENRALVANGGRAVAEVGGQLGQCDAEKRKRLARSTGPAIKRHCYSLRCAMARHSTETSGWLTRTAGACEDAVGVGATRRDDFYVLGYHAYYEKGHRL